MKSKRKSRTFNSIRNSFVSIFYNFFNILIAFVAQSIFIKTLGSEYNGIKSLFLNLLSMLSVVELGFGVAVVYNLYKPLANNDNGEVKAIMKYYKKIYSSVAVIIFVLGCLLLPFIPMLVGKTSIHDNIFIIFMLYLINSCCSYLLSYKRSILYADQKNFIVNIIDIIFSFFRNAFQIWILLSFKNIYLYLLIQIIMTILNNIAISCRVNKKYKYLNDPKLDDQISDETRNDIKSKVKGLLFHKIGGFFVTGTDNILISLSKNLGVVYVGYYANYNMIIANVALIFTTMISSVTASVGNLLVENKKNKEKNIQTYKSIFLINSWIYCFGTISIYVLAEDFIKIWIGPDFILPNIVLLVLVINFYINGTKAASNTFKEAAGIFYQDRFVPILESIVNIVCSLIFMHFFGLSGVFMGTICSSFVLVFYSYPKYVYKGIFKDKIVNYFKLYFKYFLLSSITFIISIYISSFISMNNNWLNLFVKAVICLFVPNIIYLLLTMKDKNFIYLKRLILKK